MLLLAVSWFLVALRSYAVTFFHENFVWNSIENELVEKGLEFVSALIFIIVGSNSLSTRNSRKEEI